MFHHPSIIVAFGSALVLIPTLFAFLQILLCDTLTWQFAALLNVIVFLFAVVFSFFLRRMLKQKQSERLKALRLLSVFEAAFSLFLSIAYSGWAILRHHHNVAVVTCDTDTRLYLHLLNLASVRIVVTIAEIAAFIAYASVRLKDL
jgi:hypothetical protein